MVALAQLEVADNSSTTHTTTTQLQLVSQGKDAVIGSSLVAQVVLAQRGKRNDRCSVIHSDLVTLAQRGRAEADIAEDSVTNNTITIPQVVSEVFADNFSSMHATQPQLQLVSEVKLVICMQRCGPSGMFLLSACVGMFDFGMFKHFLLSACYVLRHV